MNISLLHKRQNRRRRSSYDRRGYSGRGRRRYLCGSHRWHTGRLAATGLFKRGGEGAHTAETLRGVFGKRGEYHLLHFGRNRGVFLSQRRNRRHHMLDRDLGEGAGKWT